MAETFDSLLKQFKEITNSKLKDSKDSPAVKLLTRTVKSLETVLASFDKFLKSKNIDVGKAVGSAKDKGKSLADSGKKLLEETKQKGLKSMISGKALDIKSKLGNIFSGDKEKQNGPPGEGEAEAHDKDKTEHDDKTASKLDKAASALSEIADKLKDKLANATGGAHPLEDKKSWLDRVKDKMGKRKAEIEDEKKQVQEHGKKKGGGGGWLGKLISGVMSVGGFIVKGLSKSLWSLGGFLFKGFSKSLFRLVPALSGGIAKATQGIVMKGLQLAGRGLLSGAGAVARAALPFAGQALGLAARGAAMLLTGPVGWAVAIGTAIYAGYKLYKYLTRNDVDSDIYGKLTRLRLLMYGLNDTNKEYYSKIFDLEMVMKDYVKFNNGQVQITKLDGKAIEKILDLFSISRDEKEKYAVLNTWFMKRFIPAYKAFMTALWSVNNNIYLDQIDKLKPGDLMDFLTKFSIPGMIYNITQVPTGDNMNVLVRKEDVDAMYTNIANDIKSKAPKEKTAEEKAREANRQAAEKQKQEAAAAAAKKDTPPPSQQAAPAKKEQPVPTGKDSAAAPDAEGENKPNVKEDNAKTQAKAAGKLNKASGELAAGGMSLEGISTKLDKSKIYNLDPNVRDLFTGMAKEYHALTGKDIPVNEAFRSYEDQAALYKKMPDKAAKPGNSTHESGLAIDIASVTSQELDKMGLLRKYGFSTAVGGEKWHIEPIGVTLNPTLAKKDEAFRAKAVLSSPGHGGGGYGFLDNSVLKKRDMNYQMSIYNSGSDNPIDVAKVAAATDAKSGASPTAAVEKNDPTKISTASKLANAPAGQAPAPGTNMKSTTTTETVTGGGSKTTYADKTTYAADGEGENKPSIPTSKTPVKSPDTTPSLDGKAPSKGGNMDMAKYADLSVEAAIKQSAQMVGIDPAAHLTFAKIESNLDPNIKAKKSTATGLFQITGPTWDGLMKDYGDKYHIPADADKNNPFYNSLMGAIYHKKNLDELKGWKQLGMDETTAVYLGHHFGIYGANKILAAAAKNPNAPIKSAVSEDAYAANQHELGDQTIGGYLNAMAGRLSSFAGKKFVAKDYTGGKKTSTGPTPLTDGSDAMAFSNEPKVKIADPSNTSASKPPATEQAPVSYGTTAKREVTSKASISSSNYSSAMTSASTPKDSGSQDAYKNMFDTSKMEGVMGQQLEELRSMVGLLRSIDGKFDNKTGAPQQKAPLPPVDKTIPNSSINLSRKSIA